MTRLIRAEILKLRTTQVWFWLLLSAVALSVIVVITSLVPTNTIHATSDVTDIFTAPNDASIVVFVLGVLAVTTEFRYQTITPTVLTTPSRWMLISAKLIAYAVVGAAFALICVIVQLAMVIPWLATKGVDFPYGSGELHHILWADLVIVALHGLIGLGAGALLRNQIVAVTIGVIFLLILQNVILAIPKVRNAWPYTPNGATAAILTVQDSDSFNGVHLLGVWAGVLVLLAWALIPAVLGAGITMNRDIT
jgi:ABC-2 type transport system permease protein